MKTLRTTLLLALVLVSCGSLAATHREIAVVGKINLRAVILLHPSMRFYSCSKMAFLDTRPGAPGTSSGAERQAALNSLKARQKQLDAEIIRLRNANERQNSEFAQKYITDVEKLDKGQRDFNKQKYLIASREAEAKFLAQIRDAAHEVKYLQDQIERLTRISDGQYTDPEETNKRIAAIIAEVKQYTKAAADRHGISVVLAYNANDTRMLRHHDEYSPIKAAATPESLDYNRLFATPFSGNSADAGQVEGYYSNVTSMAQSYLNFANEILAPYENLLADNNVFIGGADLTNEVLTSLFLAYKVDMNIGNAVIRSVGSSNY